MCGMQKMLLALSCDFVFFPDASITWLIHIPLNINRNLHLNSF